MQGLDQPPSKPQRSSLGRLKSIPFKNWIIVLGLLLVILAAGWLVYPKSDLPQSVTLPDGTVYEFVAVTYGTNHLYQISPLTLLSYVPRPIAAILHLPIRAPGPQAKIATSNESVCFWIVERGKPTNNHESVSANLPDAGGRIIRQSVWSWHGSDMPVFSPLSNAPINVKYIHGWCFAAFPRREKTILLRLTRYNPSKQQHELVAEFHTPNPGKKWFVPKWKPDPLPITKDDGDLEFTLTKLVDGVDMRDPSRPSSNGGTVAQLRIAEHGRMITNWQPVNIISRDPPGSVAGMASSINFTTNQEQGITFVGGLNPEESAWKMTVEFSRSSGFLPEEIWTVKNLATNLFLSMEYMGEFPTNIFLARTNLQGLILDVANISFDRHETNLVSIHIRNNPKSPEYRITLLNVTDDQGRQLRRGGSRSGVGRSWFDVYLFEDSRSINVTVALHRSRIVEFVAKPEVLKVAP